MACDGYLLYFVLKAIYVRLERILQRRVVLLGLGSLVIYMLH